MRGAQEEAVAPKVGVRLSGTGGQGLVLAGRILAEAGAIHCGLNVVFTMSYGPEARGGASRSDVILSPGEVDDLVSDPVDILVCLSQKACDRYFPHLVYRGFMLVDSTNVTVVPTSRAVELPLTETARARCGGPMVTNVLALAVMCALTGIVTRPSLRAALETTVRPEFLAQNFKALDWGYRLAEKYMGGRKRGADRPEIASFACLRGEAPAKGSRGRRRAGDGAEMGKGK